MTLSAGGQAIRYGYKGRKVFCTSGADKGAEEGAEKAAEKEKAAEAVIPDICTKVRMGGKAEDVDVAEAEEGIAFSPVFHLAATKTLSKGGMETWLSLEKAN